MRAVIERAPLLAAVARLMGVVERRNTIALLGNIAITMEPGRVRLRATDLDMEAIEVIAAAVDEPGVITVPADKLHDIVRNADVGSQITIATKRDDPRVVVQSGRSVFKVASMSAEDFPVFPADGLCEPWLFPAKTLADMVARVSFIRGETNLQTAFSATLLCIEGDELHAMCACKSGIAVRREKAPAGATIEVMLLPKFTNQLTRWLSELDEEAEISWSERLIRVVAGSSTLTSKVFDGVRLNYAGILLEGQENAARTDQDALSSAAKRVMIMGEGKAGSVRLNFAEGGITLAARQGDAGEGADEIAAEYGGPDVSFLIHADNFLGALSNLRGDAVEVGFATQQIANINDTGKVVIRAPSDPGLLINLMQTRA